MIVVDSSALVAIFENEPDARLYAEKLAAADTVFVSALIVHETSIVMAVRHGSEGTTKVWSFVKEVLSAEICPFDEVQARFAIEAYLQFGRGSGSPAKLNMADCASYALAKSMNLPLLFKGNDFTYTDIAKN